MTATSRPRAPDSAGASTVRSSTRLSSAWTSPCATYRSVGKLSVSERITERPRWRSSAALSSLKTLIEVESATITSPARAPISDAIAHPLRPADPVVAVPAADEIPSPRLDDLAQPCGRGDGQRAQRIAVEIDHVGGQGEPRAAASERIASVHRLDGRTRDGGHGSRLLVDPTSPNADRIPPL